MYILHRSFDSTVYRGRKRVAKLAAVCVWRAFTLLAADHGDVAVTRTQQQYIIIDSSVSQRESTIRCHYVEWYWRRPSEWRSNHRTSKSN